MQLVDSDPPVCARVARDDQPEAMKGQLLLLDQVKDARLFGRPGIQLRLCMHGRPHGPIVGAREHERSGGSVRIEMIGQNAKRGDHLRARLGAWLRPAATRLRWADHRPWLCSRCSCPKTYHPWCRKVGLWSTGSWRRVGSRSPKAFSGVSLLGA